MKYRQGKYEQPIFSLNLTLPEHTVIEKICFKKSSEQQSAGRGVNSLLLSYIAFSELSDHGRESTAEPGRPAHRRSAVGIVTSC
jgi:hypothetical protein